MQCPSFESLAMYATEAQEVADKNFIDRHIAEGCERCAEQLNFCRDAAAALRDPLDAGPDSLMDEARSLFERSSYMSAPAQAIVFASMIFDSLSQAGLAGARSAPAAIYNRRLLYRANVNFDKPAEKAADNKGFDVDISIKRLPETGNFVVRGQILIDSANELLNQALNVSIYRNGNNISGKLTNELGEFAFRDISEGNYNLQIKSEKWIVVLDLPVTLSPPINV